MNLLVGTLAMGLLLSLLALGIFITYRILDSLDLTTDGSFGLAAAVAATLLARGVSPVAATVIGGAAGAAAGALTGVAHTVLRVNLLLAGILTSTALYSVNLYIMGGGSVSLVQRSTLFTFAERLWHRAGLAAEGMPLFGTMVSPGSWAQLTVLLALAVGGGVALDQFFRTDTGLAMRAVGDNPRMARAQSISVDAMTVLGLALANGLVGLSGALFAQYQGFANVEMGLGMIVTGLACVILGEALFGKRGVRRRIAGVIVGTVAFRLLVSAALRSGLDPNALKLVTALFVFAVLVLPGLVRRGVAGRRLNARSSRA
jgi:putative ABC transport system permease protein